MTVCHDFCADAEKLDANHFEVFATVWFAVFNSTRQSNSVLTHHVFFFGGTDLVHF